MEKVEISSKSCHSVLLESSLGRSESMFFVVVFLAKVERIKGVRAAVRTLIQKLGVCLNGQFWISSTCGVKIALYIWKIWCSQVLLMSKFLGGLR